MLILFGILVILTSAILGLIVLIQNPKGGGLSSSFGGFGNQLMGVKQTTDVLEKGTWLFAGIVGLLCIMSPAFIPKTSSSAGNELFNSVTPQTPKATAPATTVPMPTATPDTGKH
ncbi:MAG: preprotein translocase subunit SecG [Sphingobacteriales bacterium]|nr:preprotein translocase subunit SecG [Sphingobacteriales bacterium]